MQFLLDKQFWFILVGVIFLITFAINHKTLERKMLFSIWVFIVSGYVGMYIFNIAEEDAFKFFMIPALIMTVLLIIKNILAIREYGLKGWLKGYCKKINKQRNISDDR